MPINLLRSVRRDVAVLSMGFGMWLIGWRLQEVVTGRPECLHG